MSSSLKLELLKISLAIFDRNTEAGVMEELRKCREEREILRQKLHIHLDRWTLDKIILKERAANVRYSQ
jgi:hypothetical protein